MKKPVSIVLNGTTPGKITVLRHWIPAFAGMTNWGHYKYGNDDVESVGGDGEERRNDELGALQVRE